MLDTLVLHVPIQQQYVVRVGSLHSVFGEVAHYGLRAYGAVEFDIDTKTMKPIGTQKHIYESITSAYAGMAFKFMSHNVANTRPYIELKASAKFLQGHNVFGSDDVQKLACFMLAKLREAHPIFYLFLDIDNARISRIDATYSARLKSQDDVMLMLEYLRNLSNGQRRSDKDRRDFYNTVYWGGQTSRWGNAVAYSKYNDVIDYYKDKVAKSKTCQKTKEFLENIFYDDLLEYANGLLRFESRTKARLLEKLGLPTNLWAFIRHQKQKEPNVLQRLWKYWFKPIFAGLKGKVVDLSNDNDIRELCRQKLVTTTKTGRTSYTKAENAFDFYCLLKQVGYERLKARFKGRERSFQMKIKDLVDIGISKMLLQNVETVEQKKIPVFKLIAVDFTQQYPVGYDPSIDDDEYPSYYYYDKFIYPPPPEPHLRLVA